MALGMTLIALPGKPPGQFVPFPGRDRMDQGEMPKRRVSHGTPIYQLPELLEAPVPKMPAIEHTMGTQQNRDFLLPRHPSRRPLESHPYPVEMEDWAV